MTFRIFQGSVRPMTDAHTYSHTLTATEAAAVLRWYVAAGVDIAVGEAPVDRTVALPPPPQAAPPRAEPQHTPQPQTMPAAPRAAAGIRAPDVSDAASLTELKARIDTFTDCPLRRMATQTVLGNGTEDADLMVIGEAPGADEDRSGIPFVGRAGQLLDRMLASIDHPRDTVYVSNIIPWRPPGNRTPTQEEVSLCLPFILRAIELVQPKAILLLGGSSAHALMESHAGITRLRGQWKTLERPNAGLSIPILATFHPAYLLRQPRQKSLAWRDLLSLKAQLAKTSPST